MVHQNADIIVLEETCCGGGICAALASELATYAPNCSVKGIDLGNGFVPHGKPDMLYKHCGLDVDAIADYVREVLRIEDQEKT